MRQILFGALALGATLFLDPQGARAQEMNESPLHRSTRPYDNDWGFAPWVPTADAPFGCDVRQVREWMRLHCERSQDFSSVAVLGGSGEDVDVTVRQGTLDIVFPVRESDRRVIQVNVHSFEGKYSGEPEQEDAFTLQQVGEEITF